MKRWILLALVATLSSHVFAQDVEGARRLINEGVALHDQGDFNGAISKYDEALTLDKDNLTAMSEKALSLVSQKSYGVAISVCKKAIKVHRGDKDLNFVYTAYANALDLSYDHMGAIRVYNQALKHFPDDYQLHFNKGITLAGIEKYDEAIECFEKSARIQPQHASSHAAIGRLQEMQNNYTQSLMAYSRFLVIEPQGSRASGNLIFLQGVMKANVEKNDDNNITISLNPDDLDVASSGKRKENDFSGADLMLSMASALDYDSINKGKSDVQLFMRKMNTLCSYFEETKKGNFGFYWEFYVPYFIELKEHELIETFSYLIFASQEDNQEVQNWLKANNNSLEKFYDWSSSFHW